MGLIACMTFDIFRGSKDDYKLSKLDYYSILLCKFFSSCALHFMLYPEVAHTMTLMKYVINHPHLFTNPNIALMVPMISTIVNVLAEFINLFMLLNQHSIEHTIIHFVALEILVEIPHIYMGSLIDD
jgi:hypothetical protein